MKTNRAAFNAALVKWFNIKDAATQESMYREALEIPSKPYPAVEGIKSTLAIYDSPADAQIQSGRFLRFELHRRARQERRHRPAVQVSATASESELKPSDEPFELFREWFAEAKAHEPNDPDAMALATVDATGFPMCAWCC